MGTYRRDRHGPPLQPLELVKPRLTKLPGIRESRKWVRNESDEKAISAGYRFSEELAAFTVQWIAHYLRFSEGIWAGRPFELADWQRDEIVYPAFGWVHKYAEPPFDGRIARRIRKIYCEVAKKNGKSPLAAAIGIYMWAGDGEPGAHAAACALDHNQAAIVHEHAVRMVKASPRIRERCKINRHQHRMLMQDTESVFGTLSEEQRGAERSEGKNFHFMSYDEVHVARSRRLYEATEYAFESRPEPLWFGLTTAGEENTGLWYSLREYGESVGRGEIEDPAFLACIHRAQREDPWDEEETWRKANPSIGITITLSGLKSAATKAKSSTADVAAFRRYRTNVAPGATHPWLDSDDWDACLEGFYAEDLRGMTCFGGLDLSRTMDMTAFALMFPDTEIDGIYRQLVWFWMPRKTVERRAQMAPYFAWADRGDLTITTSDRIAYKHIEERIVWANELFTLQAIAYDPLYADKFTEDLEREHRITRVEFRQTIMQYAEPTAEYESLIKLGNLKHNGNQVLKWQAGHCEVYEGRAAGGNPARKPVKRKHGDHRTVDGIQAGVMALQLAISHRENSAFFETF